ncbi:MAG: SIR2 family protein [Anaerolineae bacterium]|nr:SIR2 family protein [Anaerolineae bacterium]
MSQPSIFISYSQKDDAAKDKLLSHLGVLQRAGLISLWSADQIGAGDEWAQAIDQAIARAKVAILLISANFLTSDFILSQEVPKLLKRRQEEGLVVFPVITTACAWRMVDWLAEMQVRPQSGKPVYGDGGSHVDEDFAEIAVEVGRIVRRPDRVVVSPDQPTSAPVEEPLQTLDDRDWDSLLYRIKAGQCTPFLGPEIIREIVSTDHEVATGWAREHAYPLHDVHNLPRVAQFLAIKRDPAFPADEFARYLNAIEMQPDYHDPDEPHSFFANLPLPFYITTNYDDFLVQALGHHARNSYREVCRWNRYVKDQPSVFDPGSNVNFGPTNPVVYHLFGHTDLPESMVLTEDDYLDFLVNISRNAAIIPRQIEKALVQTSLLFIGYEVSDIRFRILFRGLVASLQRGLRRTSIAVQIEPKPPETGAITIAQVRDYLQDYLAKDDVRVYWGDSFEFVKELRARWEDFNG